CAQPLRPRAAHSAPTGNEQFSLPRSTKTAKTASAARATAWPAMCTLPYIMKNPFLVTVASLIALMAVAGCAAEPSADAANSSEDNMTLSAKKGAECGGLTLCGTGLVCRPTERV